METHFLSPLLITLFLFLLPAGKSDLSADRAALLRLSSAVRGRTIRWNQSDPNPCLWDGVHCDNFTNRVTDLRLPGDGLSGQIPLSSIGNLTHLRILSLRRNSLSGPLPSDLGLCIELRELFLQENSFSGEIPVSLFGLSNLNRLNLAGNSFSGEISVEFNRLTSLRTLHLENNNLNGSIPDSKVLSELGEFNVSFNRLNGSIPTNLVKFGSGAYLGNSLCGSPLSSCPGNENQLSGGGNKFSGGAVAGISIGSVIGSILILAILLILWRKYGNREMVGGPTEKSPVPEKPIRFEFRGSKHFSVSKNNRSGKGYSKHIIVRENSGSGKGYSRTESEKGMARRVGRNVITNNGSGKGYSSTETERGTEGRNVITNCGNEGLVFFSDEFRVFGLDALLRASAEVLGKGTFGTTYRAYLEGNIEVVVKRLKDVCVLEREFREKVESLGLLDHENLVPLRAYYYGKDEKLLVYDSMPMGSLAALLHGNREADRSMLTWEIRSRIAFGAALGINYLHSLNPTFSHGNITSSNILLTDNYHTCVSEFGISQLVSTPNPNGYRAPEVTESHKISQKADVYSYGVLLFELLTGRSATVYLGDVENVDLPRWVRSVVKEKWTIDVFDPELLRYHNFEDQMVQLLHLAISCTSQNPKRRPSMIEITKRIKEIGRSR